MPGSLSLPGRFNVADHFILPNLTSGRAERPYLYCGEAVLTYDGLHRQANRVGNVLRRLGVRRGQRVLLLMDDSLAFPTCFWGAVRVGAVAVPLNTVLTPREYRHYLDDSRGSVLIVDAALWPRVAPIAHGLCHLRHTIIANGTVAGLPALESLLAAEGDMLRTALRSPDDPAFWLYTSGSTGPPKAAVHRQRDMVYVAEHYLRRVLRLRAGSTRCQRSMPPCSSCTRPGCGDGKHRPRPCPAWNTCAWPSRAASPCRSRCCGAGAGTSACPSWTASDPPRPCISTLPTRLSA